MRLFEYWRDNDLAGALPGLPMRPYGDPAFDDAATPDLPRPSTVIVVNGRTQDCGTIELDDAALRIGAFVRLGQIAAHGELARAFPALAQSVQLSAAGRSRIASAGGSVLNGVRCLYFRRPGTGACNRLQPGSGCAALAAPDRRHAVLGISEYCIAAHPGELAPVLIALGAQVEITRDDSVRLMPIEDLHAVPADRPDLETVLQPGDFITRFIVPVSACNRRSVYARVRDPHSYDAALASAAVALDIQRGAIRRARVALGGVATKPWRSRAAEDRLIGSPASGLAFRAAARAAFAEATVRKGTAFKVSAGQRILVRALRQAAALRVG